MAMMRRGPLAQYSAEWVLRQASGSEATGSVEFHTNQPLTLYLRSGQICHGVDGVPASGFVAATEDGEHPDETAARAQAAALVARALRATDGWYYFDPLGHHDDAGPWQWDAASLIRDARVQLQPPHAPGAGRPSTAPAAPLETIPAATPAPREATPAPLAAEPAPGAQPSSRSLPVERRVRLVVPAEGGSVSLSAESWRIVCGLVAPRDASELREALGWSPARLDAALTELAAAGVMDAPPTATAPAVASPSAPQRSASPPAPAPSPVAPVVPPPVAAAPSPRASASVDRRSALRRLISNLKPA